MEKDNREHEFYPLKSILNIDETYNYYHLQFRSRGGSEICTKDHPILHRTWKSIKMDLAQGLGTSSRGRSYY